MKILDNKEIPDSIKCWCGCSAYFHHFASSKRNDGKRTIWYKCLSGHRSFNEIQEGRERVSEKPKKKKSTMQVSTTNNNKNE